MFQEHSIETQINQEFDCVVEEFESEEEIETESEEENGNERQEGKEIREKKGD